jgi:hypothetical protein
MDYIDVWWWWCVLGGSLPTLYSPGGKVTDLRNPILADYNSCIRRGYDIYPNRLCFLNHQVSLLASHGLPSSSEIHVALSGELGHLVWRGPCGAMRVYGSVPPHLAVVVMLKWSCNCSWLMLVLVVRLIDYIRLRLVSLKLLLKASRPLVGFRWLMTTQDYYN